MDWPLHLRETATHLAWMASIPGARDHALLREQQLIASSPDYATLPDHIKAVLRERKALPTDQAGAEGSGRPAGGADGAGDAPAGGVVAADEQRRGVVAGSGRQAAGAVRVSGLPGRPGPAAGRPDAGLRGEAAERARNAGASGVPALRSGQRRAGA